MTGTYQYPTTEQAATGAAKDVKLQTNRLHALERENKELRELIAQLQLRLAAKPHEM